MKKNLVKIIPLFLFLMTAAFFLEKCAKVKAPSAEALKNGLKSKGFYELKAETLEGEPINFKDFKGKKVLIVNTASKCGFTGQFEGLQELYSKNKERLIILGFPSNQFGEQEPGSNKEVAAFCKLNYGVEFPMFEKGKVKGDNKQFVYKWLTDKKANGWNEREPQWNFNKYLIDENGNLVKYFNSFVGPDSKDLLESIK